jgi:hypothetical protein
MIEPRLRPIDSNAVKPGRRTAQIAKIKIPRLIRTRRIGKLVPLGHHPPTLSLNQQTMQSKIPAKILRPDVLGDEARDEDTEENSFHAGTNAMTKRAASMRR